MFGTMKQRIYKLLLIYVVLVAIFALQHPVFIACYHSLFRGVGLGGVCAATWHGLRMDMAMAGYLAIVPGLLAAASVWTAGRAMRYAACIYSAVAAAVVSLSFVVDLCLYGYWGFRLDATPVFYFFTSPADAVASVSGWFVVMGLLAAAAYGAGVYWVLQKILTADVPLLPTLRSRIVATAVAIVLTGVLFIPIRGGFTTSTMNLSAAYFSQNQRLNHAAINPLFSFMHSMAHQTDFASQIDIAATLLYQLGIDHSEFTFSKNMLNPASPHFGYFTEPSFFGMVTDTNQLVYNLDGEKVMLDEGSEKGRNLLPGKAFLQKLYDDLDKR